MMDQSVRDLVVQAVAQFCELPSNQVDELTQIDPDVARAVIPFIADRCGFRLSDGFFQIGLSREVGEIIFMFEYFCGLAT